MFGIGSLRVLGPWTPRVYDKDCHVGCRALWSEVGGRSSGPQAKDRQPQSSTPPNGLDS